jgi:hypothetical protein
MSFFSLGILIVFFSLTSSLRVHRTIGTHHKTGTILAVHISNAMERYLTEDAVTAGFFSSPSFELEPKLFFFSFPKLINETMGVYRGVSIGETLNLLLCPCSRLIHIVRDPIDLIVSAYFYHLHTSLEEWLFTRFPLDHYKANLHPSDFTRVGCALLREQSIDTNANITCDSSSSEVSASYRDILTHLGTKEGLLFETQFANRTTFVWMKRVLEIHQKSLAMHLDSLLSHCHNPSQCSKHPSLHTVPPMSQIYFEDFSRDYNTTITNIFTHLGGDSIHLKSLLSDVAQYNAKTMTAEEKSSTKHISSELSKREKEQLIRHVMSILNTDFPNLQELRRMLGYK